jgi:tRNA threonylcarbamoyladenosine biosynthesis protein TsaB
MDESFNVIDHEEVLTKNNLTDLMVELIDNKMKLHNKKLSDISSVYLVDGPGSFTGVRVSTVLAKTICITNYANLYSCSSNYFQTKSDKKFISVIDARANKKYLLIKNKYNSEKIKIVTNDNILEIVQNNPKHDFYNYYDTNFILQNIKSITAKKFKKVRNILKFKPRYVKNYI